MITTLVLAAALAGQIPAPAAPHKPSQKERIAARKHRLHMQTVMRETREGIAMQQAQAEAQAHYQAMEPYLPQIERQMMSPLERAQCDAVKWNAENLRYTAEQAQRTQAAQAASQP
jgi:hypothetical protein